MNLGSMYYTVYRLSPFVPLLLVSLAIALYVAILGKFMHACVIIRADHEINIQIVRVFARLAWYSNT